MFGNFQQGFKRRLNNEIKNKDKDIYFGKIDGNVATGSDNRRKKEIHKGADYSFFLFGNHELLRRDPDTKTKKAYNA